MRLVIIRIKVGYLACVAVPHQRGKDSRNVLADFAFRLSKAGLEQLAGQIARSDQSGNRSQTATGCQKHRNPRFLPYAFSVHRGVAI